MSDKAWLQPIPRDTGGPGGDSTECGDFKRGACFRATCKFLHGGKPASEVAGSGIPGATNNGSAGLPTPKPAGHFMAPTDLDVNMYDPNTGFGLFGTTAFGTRFGQMTPLAKIDNVRPLCMDFFKNGFCNRRGPHNQGCLFRHDEIEGQGKIETVSREAGREVEVFKAEAMGWNAQAVVKEAYSDMAQAAKGWAKSKQANAAAAQASATPSAAAAGVAAGQPTASHAAAPTAAAALPAGWKEAKAPDGRTYFFHVETKATQWTKPAAPTGPAEPPLPAGWKEAKAPDGRTYYYRPGHPGTQWARPTEAADAPAAAPAPAPAATAEAAEAAAPAEAPVKAEPDAADGADGANGTAADDDEHPAKRARQGDSEE